MGWNVPLWTTTLDFWVLCRLRHIARECGDTMGPKPFWSRIRILINLKYCEKATEFEKKIHFIFEITWWEIFSNVCGLLRISELYWLRRCSLFLGPIIVKKTKMGGRVHISFTSKQIQNFRKIGPSTIELHQSHYVRPLVPANFHKHVYLPSIFENIPLILLYFRKSE